MSRVPSRDGGGGRGPSVLLLLVAVVALAGVAVPAASFTTADVPRGAAVAVTDDANGVVGLNKATSVQKGSVDRLVTVTDNFGEPITVTVSLADGSDGTLYYDENGNGTRENLGTSVTISLAPGGSADVYVEATDNARLPYDVTGDTGDASFSLQRSAIIKGGNGNGNGSGGGTTDPGCENGNKQNCN